jgi:hypothetical protein
MRPVRVLLLAAAPVVLSACASLARIAPADRAPRLIEVQNAHESEVAVYLRRGNYEHPLGVVAPNSRATLLVPRHLVKSNGTLQLIGDPKGVGASFEMRPFRLEGDQYAKWEITQDPRYSQLTVWSPVAPGAASIAIRAP